MKEKYSIILILILYSCNVKTSDQKKGNKKIQSEIIIKKNEKIESKTEVEYSELFNVELVGLTKDSKNNKRYYVDFSSACYCNTPSILLKEKKAYLFGYCKDTLPPLSKDPFYTYNIIETNEINNGLSLSLRNKKNKILTLTFNKSKNEFIYKLKVIGEFPNDYIGSNVCSYFTFNPNKFEIEDCGDFDG